MTLLREPAMIVRWLNPDKDWSSVEEIDRHSFLQCWDQKALEATVKRKGYVAMVADHGGLVVGYTIYRLHARSIEIVRLAVHPAFRNKGAGRAIINKLKGRLTDRETKKRAIPRNKLEVYLSEWNETGHSWTAKMGFLATEVVSGKPLTGTEEDLYHFEYWYDHEELNKSLLQAAKKETGGCYGV